MTLPPYRLVSEGGKVSPSENTPHPPSCSPVENQDTRELRLQPVVLVPQ